MAPSALRSVTPTPRRSTGRLTMGPAVLAVAHTVVSVFNYARFLAPVYSAPLESPVATLSRWSSLAATAGVAVLAVGIAAAVWSPA